MDSRDHLRRRRRIVVAGPLAAFAGGLRQDLAARGYALDTVTEHVHLLADLSGWLASAGLTAADLTGEAAGEFLGARRAAGHRTGVSARALAPVLGYLRSVQAAPPQGRPVPATPVEALLAVYQQYLEGERGLSAGTVTHYLRYAQAFLAGFPGPLTETLAGLSAGQVTGYVLELARRRRGRPPDMVVLPALRSLLRYLHAAGHIRLPLAAAVPAGRAWRPGLPRAASSDHLRAVLASCDRDSAGGRRDYAIVLVMTRLALRGGEVAGLDLADVGWRTGELAIHGKGGRMDTLPLPVDVGEAMADYLLHGAACHDITAPVRGHEGPVRRPCGVLGDPGGGPGLRAGRGGAVRAAPDPPCGGLRSAVGRCVDGGDRSVAAPCPAAHHSDLRQGRSGPAGRAGHALPAGSPAMSMEARAGDYLAMRRSLGFKLCENLLFIGGERAEVVGITRRTECGDRCLLPRQGGYDASASKQIEPGGGDGAARPVRRELSPRAPSAWLHATIGGERAAAGGAP